MNGSFSAKRLKAVITLADDSNTVFDGSGNNTLTIENLRMTATVVISNRQASELNLSIYGMLTKDMDALTSAWISPDSIRDNRVTLYADNGNGYRLVFIGTIIEAMPDYKRIPDVPFQIMAKISYFKQIEITPPLSYQGAVDINVIGQDLAGKLGLSFVSNVKSTLTDPYYPGTVFDQLRNACIDARVDFYFQGETLVFTPLLQPFTSIPAVLLTPNTGLVGYPIYTRRGLQVTALFDPAYLCGSTIQIQDSRVKGINGLWYPRSIQFDLSANMPNGPWFATMQCNKTAI